MHQEYIEKIISSTDDEKMHRLKDLLIDTLDYVENKDKSIYNKIECDLYEIAEGEVIDEHKAVEWVSKMIPKAYWTMGEITELNSKYDISMPLLATYVIMNMLYSDFGDVLGEPNENIDNYIKAAEDWYYDEDAKKTEDKKLYNYWKHIVN